MSEELTPQTPRDYLTLGPSTQTQIDVFSDGVIESVKRGEINPLTVLIQLRAIERASGRILKEIHENVMNEANKYPGNEFEYQGNKVTKTEHGVKYDYSGCNDVEWLKLKAQETLLKSNITERETFLKALKIPLETLERSTGEVATLYPPTKKSTSGVNVSIR